MIKMVFYGTGEFARDILAAFLATPDFEVMAVITVPNRPVGRDQTIIPSPVKDLAQSRGIPVSQPVSLKKNPTPAILADYDLAVVAEYGLLIPEKTLVIPHRQTLNVHPSLLPAYRGASPLQSAIAAGETLTGVSIMLLDAEMDHGPILAQEKITIGPNDTFFDLRKKITPLAATLAVNTARDWAQEKIIPREQDHTAATFCRVFEKNDGQVDFLTETAEKIYNKYRGFIAWPGVWTIIKNKKFKLLRIGRAEPTLRPGEIKAVDKKLFIGAQTGTLEIMEIQPEGKKPLAAADFINGYQTFLS